jgi:hypothetical protein
MVKTTVYIPDDLKIEVSRIARTDGISEAEVIRRAIQQLAESRPRRLPRFGIFASDDPTLAERVDEVLAEGFGEWETDADR